MPSGSLRTQPMRALLLASLLATCGCRGALRDGVYVKDTVQYRVGLPDAQRWKSLAVEGNDLAWAAAGGHLLAINATCDNHGDPSLEVLTNHLVFGFTERNLVGRKEVQVDGRDALDSRYTAKLDGVPVELRLLVLKKNGCVHDFSYIAPLGHFEAREADFDRLLQGFAQLKVKSP